jgi:hypothetical protein
MLQTLIGFLGIGLTLVGLGIVILTTDKLAGLSSRPYVGWSLLSLGTVMSAVSIFIGVLKLLRRMSSGVHKIVSRRVLERFEYEFEDEYCSAEKINEVFTLDDSILSRFSRIDEDFLKRRHRLNGNIIRCARKKKVGAGYLSGFYIVYPINQACEKLIEEGYLTGSRMIREEHICSRLEDASSIYVSMVYGRDMPTRGFIVYLLKRDLRRILRDNKNIDSIYARPDTEEGFLLAERFDLRQMPNNPEIWKRKVE